MKKTENQLLQYHFRDNTHKTSNQTEGPGNVYVIVPN